MKITRLQRILHLISLLQTDRYSRPNDLAQELAIDRRTVFRDLKTLKDAGIPYYFDEKENGYKLDSDFLLPPLNLTLPEALSLLLVARHVGEAEGLPLQKNAQKAAMKIESALPSRIQRHCGSILKATSVKFAARARTWRRTEGGPRLPELPPPSTGPRPHAPGRGGDAPRLFRSLRAG